MQTSTRMTMALVALTCIVAQTMACGGGPGQICSGACAVGQSCHGTDGDCFCSSVKKGLKPSDFKTETDWHLYTNQTAAIDALNQLCKYLQTPAGKLAFIEVDGLETQTWSLSCEEGKIRAISHTEHIDVPEQKNGLLGEIEA